MKKEDASIILGALLVISSVTASIAFKFYFWCSFFVIGAFMLLGGLNYKLKSKSVYSYILKNKWESFFTVYFAIVILGFIIDPIYGRYISGLWSYPHLVGAYNFIIPVFLFNPFAGMQIYELFYFCKNLLSKIFKSKKVYKLSNNIKNFISSLLILFLVSSLIVPVINLVFNSNNYAVEILVIFMVLIPFSFDALVYKIKKDSILFDFIQGDKLVILTVMLSWIITVIFYEIPNIFSWEWIYNVPFTSFEIFKINILIFTFGWLFLVCTSVRFIDLVKTMLKLKNN